MSTHFLVINQHGDNRGDEAALRGLLDGIGRRFPDAEFTVIHQFAAPASKIHHERITYLPMRIPVHEAARLSAWAALRRLGADVRGMLGPIGRETVGAYEAADIVLSAPGGPYFGDLYADHEVVHWFYTWMAHLHRRHLVLYQPSCGPFENRLLNPLRKAGFKWFDAVAVRESISADLLEGFTGVRPLVGSDSALQHRVAPLDPSTVLGFVEPGATRPIVTATFRDPGPQQREQHDAAVVELLAHVSSTGRTVVLLPQLHGPRHRDQPYLQTLADRSNALGASVHVASEELSSDEQRGIVAASDVVLAGRYHPLVFAVSAGVPALVIPYEHKATGFARAAGLDAYVVELDALDGASLTERFDHLCDQRDELAQTVSERGELLGLAADSIADRVAFLTDQSRTAS